MSMNITHKFKTDNYHEEYFLAAKAYRLLEFQRHFDKIRAKNPQIAEYLQNLIGFEKWVRAYFPRHCYNVLTTRISESLNKVTVDARSYPITMMLEFVWFTLQRWFFERCVKAKNVMDRYLRRRKKRYEYWQKNRKVSLFIR